MKLSKEEQKQIAEFRKKIEDAKKKDIIQLLEEMGFNVAEPEKLKIQLEAAKTAAPELFDIATQKAEANANIETGQNEF